MLVFLMATDYHLPPATCNLSLRANLSLRLRANLGSSYFEQDLVVTDDGCEPLTQAQKRWW